MAGIPTGQIGAAVIAKPSRLKEKDYAIVHRRLWEGNIVMAIRPNTNHVTRKNATNLVQPDLSSKNV